MRCWQKGSGPRGGTRRAMSLEKRLERCFRRRGWMQATAARNSNGLSSQSPSEPLALGSALLASTAGRLLLASPHLAVPCHADIGTNFRPAWRFHAGPYFVAVFPLAGSDEERFSALSRRSTPSERFAFAGILLRHNSSICRSIGPTGILMWAIGAPCRLAFAVGIGSTALCFVGAWWLVGEWTCALLVS